MSTGPPHPAETTAAVKFSRLPSRGILLGLTGPQLACLGAAIILVVGSLYTAGAAGLAITMPLWALAIAAATIPAGGKKTVDWAPIALGWQTRKLRGRTTYHRSATARSSTVLRLPGQADPLRLVTDRDTAQVMIHDPRAMTLTATFEIGHAGFPLQDASVQQRRVSGWGRALSACCRTGRIARIQILQRSIPDSSAGLAAWWNAHGSDDDAELAQTYQDLIDRAGPTAQHHVTTLSVALDLRAAARRIRTTGGGLEAAAEILRQDIDTLRQALTSADLEPSPQHTGDELTTAIQTAYISTPPVGIAAEQPPAEPAGAGPVRLEEYWDFLRADGAYHAVLWISQWPQSRVHPGFLAPLLLHSGVRRSLALSSEPMRLDRAIRDLRKKKTEHIADAAHRARIGQIEDARDTAELQDVRQQETELTYGHGLLRYTGLITVTADSRNDLEAAVAEAEQDALQACCETQRLYGQQAHAFLAAALPLCHGW